MLFTHTTQLIKHKIVENLTDIRISHVLITFPLNVRNKTEDTDQTAMELSMETEAPLMDLLL